MLIKTKIQNSYEVVITVFQCTCKHSLKLSKYPIKTKKTKSETENIDYLLVIITTATPTTAIIVAVISVSMATTATTSSGSPTGRLNHNSKIKKLIEI